MPDVRTTSRCEPGRRCCGCTPRSSPGWSATLAAVGMPLSWYDVLLELNAAPGPPAADDRARCAARCSAASGSAGSSTSSSGPGLVRRERNPDDGRSLLAVITDEGRARLRAAAPAYLAGIERHFGAHVGDDAATVAAALLRVVEAAADSAGGPAPARESVQIGTRM